MTLQRGPAALGRNAVVLPGQAAPAQRASAPRIAASLSLECVAELRAAAQQRLGVVIEVSDAVAPEVLVGDVATDPPHVLGPRFTLLRDDLHHLIVTNSVDHRAAPAWSLLDTAVRLGATPAADGTGDVVLPDGTLAWLDGGPFRFTPPIDGVPVLHRVGVEHGSLAPPGSNESGAELAADQLAAVTHPGGAARIIAPAGSGKTRVLTARARHLVRRWNVPASAVTLVAFNKRAQEEMSARTRDMPGLQVRTLNAIALAVVNGSPPFAPRNSRRATIDEGEVRRLIGKLVSFPRKRNADPVATWIEALSAARLGLRSPADVEAAYDGDVAGFAEVLPRYRQALERAGQADFDEQVLLAVEMLLTMPAVRHAAQRACRLLLVDEFQDLTPAHLLLVRLLAGPDGCVFGVGDDDQTIYGYNGADPASLIDFADLFPGAGQHPLEVNYRCPGGIVRAADTLLRHNRRRVAKVIRSAQPDLDGFSVAEPDPDTVAQSLATVVAALAEGAAAADIAVLARVNSLLAPVQAALAGVGVPCSGGVGPEFLERTAVRAALAWLRLAIGGERLRSADVDEAVRRPSRSLHPRVADWAAEQQSIEGLQRLAARINTPKDAQTVLDFAADIEVLQGMAAQGATTARLLGVVFEQIGLAGTVAGLDASRHGMNRASQSDDITALSQLAALQPDPARFGPWLRTALSADSSPDGVTLATVHRVKGQEWPVVVMHHAADDQFPHRLATNVEEERRLFHVAITRASRHVTVVASERPSPFVLDCSTEPSARRPAAATAAAPVVARSGPKRTEADLDADQQQRFERLREWRRQAAAGKPAYTVFADDTLRAIARAHPTSLDALRRVKGIGPSKLEQYGDAVLRVVADG